VSLQVVTLLEQERLVVEKHPRTGHSGREPFGYDLRHLLATVDGFMLVLLQYCTRAIESMHAGITMNAKAYSDQKVTVGLSFSKLLEGVKVAADVDLFPILNQSELHAKTTFQSKMVTSRIGFDFCGTYFSDTAISGSVVAG